MERLIKILIVGVVLCFSPFVFAEEYKVLVLPDNIVTEKAALDSYIYDATAEFFADGVVNILNETDSIKSPNISQTRADLKKEPSYMLLARNLTDRFKASYNVDYEAVKKLARKTNSDYVLLLTSTIDAQNFILRRTWWDFFNIPGASVVDPAYKINTYAVLIDTQNNTKLWSDTYYKTISTVENRIITQGPSPQNVQLEKIKDYSRYICPQIAKQVQLNVLSGSDFTQETMRIDYDLGNVDNIFTKKYRHYGEETGKFFVDKKKRVHNWKARRHERRARIEAEKNAELEVKAKPIYDDSTETKVTKPAYDNSTNIKNTQPTNANDIKNAVYKKSVVSDVQPDFGSIEIKRTRKNNLYGSYDADKLPLRDYTN